MPRFMAPKLQPNSAAPTAENPSGALNSGSEPVDNHILKSRSNVSLVPPAHPESSRAILRSGTLRVEEPPTNGDEDPGPSTGGRDDLGEEGQPQEIAEDATEEDLSEEQLRKLFENEEIERFLSHFTAHVQEVILPTGNVPTTQGLAQPNVTVSDGTAEITLSSTTGDPPIDVLSTTSDDEREGVEGGDWTVLDRSHLSSSKDDNGSHSAPPHPSSQSSLSLSETMARKFLLPRLPPVQPSQNYRFTIGRARQQVERFNLVTQPAYGPFCAKMWGYASWKSRGSSAFYCTIFWMLWFLDLLLPTLFAVILYTLFRRRIFSYPTLQELRDRRQEAARAEALGEEVERRFATGPDFGIRDAWKLFRSITKAPKKGQGEKKKKRQEGSLALTEENTSQVLLDATESDEGAVKIETKADSQVEKDIKRGILQAMSEITDLHERIKNIFLWRRPQASKNYAMAILFLLLVTLALPAKYLAKLTYFVGGFFFWFVPPLILGLPPADRARFPPAFADSPTDAQYAMEMIAMRVVMGERVVPANIKSPKRKATKAAADDTGARSREEGKGDKDKEVDWRKWGERAARGFAWAEEGKRVFKGDMPLKHVSWLPVTPLVPPVALAHGQSNAGAETSTYPAQHITSPGLLTLTSTTLSFTQVLFSTPKINIRLDHIRGVKKAGKLGGLTLRWGETQDDEHEEKFRWVGGRDEVFAKLVGWGGRRWVHV